MRGTNLITVVRSAWNHNIFRIPSLLPQPHCYSLTGFQSHFWCQEQKKVCRIPAQCSANKGAALTWAWAVHVSVGSWSHRHSGSRPPLCLHDMSQTWHTAAQMPCAQLWSDPPKLSLRMQTPTSSLRSNLSHSKQRKHLLPTGTLLCLCYTTNPNAHPSADLFPIYLQVLLREATFQNNFQEVNHFPRLWKRFSSQKHELLIS